MEEKVMGEKKPVNKKILAIIGIVVLLVIIIVAFVCLNKSKDENVLKENDGPVANTTPEIVKEFEKNGLTFSNIVLITEGTTSTMTMDVTNPTDSLISSKAFYVTLKDKDGNILTTLYAYYGNDVPAGETRAVTMQAEMDLSKAKTREISDTMPE